MHIKLIAVDIDGTLLNDNGKVQKSSIEAIKWAKEKNIKVVLVTGRPLVSTKPLLDILGLDNQDDQYVATFNGAVIETTTGKVLSEQKINFDEFVKMDKWTNEHNLYIQFETENELFTTRSDISIEAAHESWKNKLPMHIRTLDKLVNSNPKPTILKIMMVSPKQKLDKFENNIPSQFTKHLTATRSEPHYLDFATKNVNKKFAMQQLSRLLHITSDNMMALGNADNDIPMVSYVKYGVAMKNSTPKLLKTADIITGSNNKDGIADAIYKQIN